MKNSQGRQIGANDRLDKSNVMRSDLLRCSIDWVLNGRKFADLPRHGNTK